MKNLTDEELRQIARQCWQNNFYGDGRCSLYTESKGCTCVDVMSDYYERHFHKEMIVDDIEEFTYALYEIATTEVE